ncbi:DUF4296 domain-containing protein [Rufibacter roseus]|uniref:DUF4296 domain-containing protein n=1 Tax=Rufibacter roseus TaxID=1567108 RepID=A0ABW2DT56_9BACT|nr:DUF4296 domain-containing protein [Rufibacter roseus]
MRKHLCLLFMPVVLLACGPKDDKPADVVSEDAMTSLMLDIHLTEAIVNRTYHHVDTSRMVYQKAHKDLLKKHGLTDSSFKYSYDYYVQHPDIMDKIYERILDSLSLKEAKMTGKDTVAQPKPVAPGFTQGQ